MAAENTYELLVGLDVTDDEIYGRYREGMGPILSEYGGTFRYDFRVGEVLKAETSEPVNRVFVLSFPDELAKTRFFADARYLEVREGFFEGSVGATTIMAEYTRHAPD